MDLKPKLVDARIFTDSSGNPIDRDHPQGWGSMLIGGMGFGGGAIEVTDDFGSGNELRTFRSAYFALDVTIPQHPRVLWEFTHPQLGFTTSYPCIARVEESGGLPRSGNERWFVIFGSGPTDYRGNSMQAARIFVVDLKTGALVRIIDGHGAPGFMGSPISSDANLDFSTDVIYAGESFLAAEQWQGRMHRLSTRNCTGDACITANPWTYATNPEAWTSSTLLTTSHDREQQKDHTDLSEKLDFLATADQPQCLGPYENTRDQEADSRRYPELMTDQKNGDGKSKHQQKAFEQ